MAERVHDRLAERRTRDLGHFLAGGAAFDDEAAADVGEHVELGAGDEVVDRSVPLLQVEDFDAAAVGEDPGLKACTGPGRAEERCCSVGERAVVGDEAEACEGVGRTRVGGRDPAAGVAFRHEAA
ncbi:hypothetical protein H6A35_06305 [Collinsella tanakaei]|nr:hypothetical protein [Collinsella tanakaei]